MPGRPSPLQNRVAPDGTLHAVPARGLMMGNRGGRLHRPDGTLGTARWRGKAWISCRLDFHGRRRTVWGEGYTEIFFLDEATALAAGHRPCFECRRAAALAFAAAWGTPSPRAPEMDAILHAERRAAPQEAELGTLAPGTLFTVEGGSFLRTATGSRAWHFSGYGPDGQADAARRVAVLTPPSIRAAFDAGYRPLLHPSASA